MTGSVADTAFRLLQAAQAMTRRARASRLLPRHMIPRRWRAGIPARPALAADLGRIGAMCALLWGGIGLLLYEQRASALREAAQAAGNLASAFEETTAKTVEGIDHLLLCLRADYRSTPETFDLAAWSRDAQVFDDLTRRIGILDRAGRLRAAVPTVTGPGIAASDREYFRAQRDSAGDMLLVSDPLIGRESGHWVVQVTRKILAADGSFDGVAWISMDPSRLARLYASPDIGRGSVLLVGLDGIVRSAAPANSGMLARDIGASPLLAAARLRADGTLDTVGEDGAASIVSYRRLDRYGLIVAVGLDRTEVLQGYTHSRAEYLAGGGVLTILILLVGKLGIRRRQALLHAHARLLQSQQVLRTTLENMGQGIFVVDAERRIAVINRRAVELLGLPPGMATVGASFDELLRWQLRNGEFDADERIRKLAEAGRVEFTDADYQHPRPNGTVLDVRIRRLNENGGRRLDRHRRDRAQSIRGSDQLSRPL